MNIFDKIRSVCRPVRITAGAILLYVAVITGNNWFLLGIVPMIAGLMDFCPMCKITKKCSVRY